MHRLLPLLLASCAGIAPPAHEVLARAPTAEEERARPQRDAAARRERWILRRGSTEIVFTLLVEFEDGVQFVALDDLGSVLADSGGRHSQALPAAIAQRIGRLLRVKYAPTDLRPARVGASADLGWAEPGVVWIGDEMYTDGMRVRTLGPRRYEVDGSLTATVTIG